MARLMGKKAALALLLATGSLGLGGCMGQMGLSAMVTQANLKVVDNRYGRAGVFVLLSPVYGLAATADLFVVNTIEFWSGKNPVTGKSPALVDQSVDAAIRVNPHLDPALTTVPLASLPADVRSMTFSYPDADSAVLELHYQDGSKETLRGERRGQGVDLYFQGRLVSTLSQEQLIAMSRAGSAIG
ncbi:DUF3332 domain-containing protein [Aeromonas bivalvium]|uniref:DUF3332 domain-containing protein n=1 Tax=Aeromonas bivalvium TaxID=440079 RepID=UPI0038CFA895